MSQLSITEFANMFGLSRQAIDQSIKENRFRFTGYKAEKFGKRTKIVKINRTFVFWNNDHKIYLIVKENTPELALIRANDYLFEKQCQSFRFKLEEAKEIEEKEVLITNFQ